ncbi:hypothetical protein C8R43DRAFT_1020034, partial [Mycena crocata]
ELNGTSVGRTGVALWRRVKCCLLLLLSSPNASPRPPLSSTYPPSSFETRTRFSTNSFKLEPKLHIFKSLSPVFRSR